MIEEVDYRHPVTRKKLIAQLPEGDSPLEWGAPEQHRAQMREDIDGPYLHVEKTAAQVQSRISYASGPQVRNFHFNILICANGPDPKLSTNLDLRLKKFTTLANTRADILAMSSYLRNTHVSDPGLVFDDGWRFGGGSFFEDVLVSEPTKSDLVKVSQLCNEFFQANSSDPEWRGGQINLFFSGHGYVDDTSHISSLLFADGFFNSKDLLNFFSDCLGDSVGDAPWQDFNQRGLCKVNMNLDCCHAAALAIDVYHDLCKRRIGLLPGDFRCACLPHQNAKEFPKLGYGLYSYSFLSDSFYNFDSRPIEVTEESIARLTNYQQVPFRFGFNERGLFVRLPGTNMAIDNPELMSEVQRSLIDLLNSYSSEIDSCFEIRDTLQKISNWLWKNRSS